MGTQGDNQERLILFSPVCSTRHNRNFAEVCLEFVSICSGFNYVDAEKIARKLGWSNYSIKKAPSSWGLSYKLLCI